MRFVLLATAVLCSACTTVGPEYQQPQIDAPQSFVYQDVIELLNTDKPEPEVAANWWHGFDDTLLDQLIRTAIENNQQIIASAARLKAAQANVRLVDTNDAPSVTASAEGGLGDSRSLDGDTSSDSNYSVSGVLGLLLPLDVFGGKQRQLEAAQAVLEASEAELRDVILRISTDVASEYLRLRGNQRQLELLRESVALQEKTLSIVKTRFESGLSPELDLRRAETSVERLRADIPPLEESLNNSRHTLANFTGRYPGQAVVSIDDEIQIPAYRHQLVDVVPAEVLRNRPDILRLEALLKQAVAEVGVAEADFYPSFDLFAQMSISSAGIIGGTALDLFQLAVSQLVNQVVYDGGARQAQLEVARARAEEALANYNQALLDAALAIESNLLALQSSLARQQSLERAVASSARSFEQADSLYQLGLSSFLDVVDAQRVLASAEQQLAAERTSYSTRIASLFRELGTEVRPEGTVGLKQ